MKDRLRKLVRAITSGQLRQTDVPRRLEFLELGARTDGSAHLKRLYLSPPPPEEPRHINYYEAHAFSQHGEDGIICYLFDQIGTTNKRFVEFGVESGRECNCANLAINFGWSGLLMDGGAENVRIGRDFYLAMMPERPGAVTFDRQWITRENINEILEGNGLSGEIDLLSIDVDGNDYWIWKAISVVNPRAVIVEYNATFGSTRSVSVPYDPTFYRMDKHPSGFYHGASLAAFQKLGTEKNYVLVGCDSTGVNAFFVRVDCLAGNLRAFSAADAFLPQYSRVYRGLTTEQQFDIVKTLPLEEV